MSLVTVALAAVECGKRQLVNLDRHRSCLVDARPVVDRHRDVQRSGQKGDDKRDELI